MIKILFLKNIFSCLCGLMAHDLRNDAATLLRDPVTCLGALQLMWCPEQVKNAAEIADCDERIKKVKFFDRVFCFSVTGISGKEYLVVPHKYCTCHFYQDMVLKKRLAWTCKHDIAVQLRLSLTQEDSIKQHANPKSFITSQFTL